MGTHSISKKMGLSQIPLAVLAIRFTVVAWDRSKIEVDRISLIYFSIFFYLILLALKVYTGMTIKVWSLRVLNSANNEENTISNRKLSKTRAPSNLDKK